MPAPASGHQVRLSPEQKEEMRLLYWNGTHHTEIIRHYGCSTGSFWNVVRNMRQAVLEHRFDVQLETLVKIPEAKLGWVAGIVDGEGYIGVVKAIDKRRNTFTLMPRVDISSTTRVMQEELRQILGFGCVYNKTAHQKRKPNERPQYTWGIWSAAVVGPFLTVIEPYLVVKRGISSVVREFCERRMVNDMKPYTSDDIETLKTVHRLNQRGVVDRRHRAA